MAAAADADPVTLLVLGWLAGLRSENTRTAYARDIGITPQRRPSRAPSWLAWCQEQGVHPVTGVTVFHVARYARQLDAAGLSPASAARKLAAVSGWCLAGPARAHCRQPRRRHHPARGGPDSPAHTSSCPGPGPRPCSRRRRSVRPAALPYRGAGGCPAIHRRPGLEFMAPTSGTSAPTGQGVLWVTRANGQRRGCRSPVRLLPG